MAVTADQVKVILDAEVDGYNADIKQSVTVFEASMTKMERAAVQTEKRVGAAMSRTAKLTSNQLQTIQYTVNDVIASLASGSNPLTILAQQGGQVTQAFGGLNGTLRALAPFAFSAGGALTAMGVALGAAILAAEKADAEFKALETSVVGLGRTTGLSAQGLRDLAAASANAGNVTRAAAEQMAIAYSNTGAIGGQVIGKLITITDDYARATGQDAKKATEELGKAFADPTRGAEMLQAKFGLLDAETLRLIRSMQASGETAQAQEILFERLGFTLEGQVPKVGGLKGWWDRLTKSISDAAAAARDYGKAQAEAEQRQMARALGGVPTPAGESEREANRAAMRRGGLARRNQQDTATAAVIDRVLGNDQRAKIQGEIDLLQKRVAAGGKDAADASKAIKKLKEDMQSIGAGPKAPKPTKAEEREAIARAEGRVAGPAVFGNDSKYGTGLNTDTVSADDLEALERLFVSKGGLEEYIRNGGADFKAAGAASAEASDELKAYQDTLYNGTYNSIKGGLEAAFNDGVPGVAEFLGNELKRALIEDVSALLTNIVRGRDAGYGRGGDDGSLGAALLSRGKKLFGRAVGGNMVAGVPYQVNEGRPEVFVPPVSGQMVPAARLAGRGGTTVHQSFYQDFSGSLVAEDALASAYRYADRAANSARVGATSDSLRRAPAAVAKSQKQRG
ncbi:phage tail length tape measure family protein [Caulobacter hibisci]|uniref:Phage tail length tape measure family protein n=1 Tax=Caulobacter hibisci TaxID=2035993 RepID=A0ABS0SS92_9CAUL|nr:phage tail length tape measure family protein [Caulobacter hibisci]MBI1682391.1 phage tail length tape measure family protein [Caulobacter hibisci]